jgi:hypothetical protein
MVFPNLQIPLKGSRESNTVRHAGLGWSSFSFFRIKKLTLINWLLICNNPAQIRAPGFWVPGLKVFLWSHSIPPELEKTCSSLYFLSPLPSREQQRSCGQYRNLNSKAWTWTPEGIRCASGLAKKFTSEQNYPHSRLFWIFNEWSQWGSCLLVCVFLQKIPSVTQISSTFHYPPSSAI